MTILGIDLAPCDAFCCGSPNLAYVDNRRVTEKPQKGTHVDSISYYTYDLSEMNKEMDEGQPTTIPFLKVRLQRLALVLVSH